MLKLRVAFASLLFAMKAAKAKHTAKTMATVKPKAKAVVRSAPSGRLFAKMQAMARSLKDKAEKDRDASWSGGIAPTLCLGKGALHRRAVLEKAALPIPLSWSGCTPTLLEGEFDSLIGAEDTKNYKKDTNNHVENLTVDAAAVEVLEDGLGGNGADAKKPEAPEEVGENGGEKQKEKEEEPETEKQKEKQEEPEPEDHEGDEATNRKITKMELALAVPLKTGEIRCCLCDQGFTAKPGVYRCKSCNSVAMRLSRFFKKDPETKTDFDELNQEEKQQFYEVARTAVGNDLKAMVFNKIEATKTTTNRETFKGEGKYLDYADLALKYAAKHEQFQNILKNTHTFYCKVRGCTMYEEPQYTRAVSETNDTSVVNSRRVEGSAKAKATPKPKNKSAPKAKRQKGEGPKGMSNAEILRAGKIVDKIETALTRIKEHEHEVNEEELKQWFAPWVMQKVVVAKALGQEQIANFQLIQETGYGELGFIDAAIRAKDKVESSVATLKQQIAQARDAKGGDE